MSKTYVYLLVTVAVYLLIVKPLNWKSSKKEEKEEEPEADTENADENGVSQDAAGQMKYRIGYTK